MVEGNVQPLSAQHRSCDPVTVLSWAASLTRMDGGGQRVRAFLDGFESATIPTAVVPLGLPESRIAEVTADSGLHRLKRRLLPVPLRHPIESELKSQEKCVHAVSLMSGSHRWAIRNSDAAWVDYPDLWSEYCTTAAVGNGLFLKSANYAQAAVWRAREHNEAERAVVVTTASYTDAILLGEKAIWVPNPIFSISDLKPGSKARSGLACGMLANFDYPPNRIGYETLIEQWLPFLAAAGVKVAVGGFGSDRLPAHEGVSSYGVVDNVNDFYENIDFALAPITHGGGMKVKVVEALSRGLPVIAAEPALNGFPPSIARGCFTWTEFIETKFDVFLVDDRHESEDLKQSLEAFSVESFVSTISRLLGGFMK